MIGITENANQILNIVKAKYHLKDKFEAINLVVKEYETFLEPELRSEYKQKLAKIIKGKHISRAELGKALA